MAGSPPNHHEQYFRQLLLTSRELCLQYQWPVEKEEIAARLAPFKDVKENRKQKKAHLVEVEKQKKPTEEIEEARKDFERTSETEQKVEEEILKYLETVLALVQLDKQPKEVVEALMKCAILQQATPTKLANFCQESEYNTKLVYELLDSSPEIMKDMLLNGGAKGGNYGRSYRIFKHLITTIDPDDKLYGPCHRRLAMAVALEHGESIPELDTPDIRVNPFLRFRNYVEAHKAGELDPAFSYFSTWEYRYVVDSDATEGQLKWGREHLKRYRPDQVAMPDMAWRYAVAVRTDVGYRQSNWTSHPETYQQVVSGGGKCGARAWYGRFICKAFGIPTWGVRQPGHAAMSRWTPTNDGWVTILGGGWENSWWNGREGPSFRADAHSRAFLHGKDEEFFAKITLLECMAEANSENREKAEQDRFVPTSLWSSLVNAQRIILSKQATEESFYRGPPKGTTSTSFYSKIQEYRDRKDQPRHDNNIKVLDDGSIEVPGCAFVQQRNCQPMKSFGGGAQILVKADSFVEYKMPGHVGERQIYEMILEICNVHLEHENNVLHISVNGSNVKEVRIPYTKGEWGYSYPIRVSIGKGDTFRIERCGQKWGLTVKEILMMNVGTGKSLSLPSASKNASTESFSASFLPHSIPQTKILKDVSSTAEKTVKVFILLGQSNMVGMGKVNGVDHDGTLEHAVKVKRRYPFLVDQSGNWRKVINQQVRNVFIMGSGTGAGKLQKNEWMTVDHTNKIGPEIGIGYELGKWLTESSVCPCGNKDDILILKSCIGNRSLGWDLLPPGSPSFEYNDEKKKTVWHYAGYKESPSRWEKGTQPVPSSWYAGMQYDGDIARAQKILADLPTFIPDAKPSTKYEVAGFFYWQGDKDRYDAALAQRYKFNLVHLIRRLRLDFDSPDAKFVLATLGQTPMEGAKGNDAAIFNAQMSVQDMPEFQDNTVCVYSKPFCHGGASNSHYNGNAETYMDVGQAMGRAMVSLLEKS